MSKNLSLKEKFNAEKEQEFLKEKYNIAENNVVVVERKSRVLGLWRETLRFFQSSIRTLSTIALGVFALVGVASLVFPAPRGELLQLWDTLLQEISHYLGR